MPNAKTAQVNIRFRPEDLAAVKAQAAADETPYSTWCEQACLDRVHERTMPKAKPKPEFPADPAKCEHPRLPRPAFGMDSSQCPDCGLKIQIAGRQLGQTV